MDRHKRYDGMNHPELSTQVRIPSLQRLKRIKNRIAYVFCVGSDKIVTPSTKRFILKNIRISVSQKTSSYPRQTGCLTAEQTRIIVMKADAIGLHADCTFVILQKQQRETQQSGIMSPFLEQTPGSK